MSGDGKPSLARFKGRKKVHMVKNVKRTGKKFLLCGFSLSFGGPFFGLCPRNRIFRVWSGGGRGGGLPCLKSGHWPVILPLFLLLPRFCCALGVKKRSAKGERENLGVSRPAFAPGEEGMPKSAALEEKGREGVRASQSKGKEWTYLMLVHLIHAL